MSLVDFSELDTSPLRYQVAGMVPEVGTGFLWGQSWSGKSLVALDMGLAVANGTPFFGHDTIRGTVVYLAGEGLPGIGVRVKARLARQERDSTAAIAAVAGDQGDEAARAFAASLPPYTGDHLKIMTRPFPMHFTRADRPGTELRQAMSELTRLNTPGPDDDPETFPYISLIIMDALANFAGELSISNDASANRITKTMHWMSQELDCCMLAVAHPTADGAKMLGAGRLFNSADFVIRVAPDEVAAPGALKTATVSCQKSKDGKEFEPFGYRIEPCMWDEPVLDGKGNPTGETEVVTSATVTMIEDGKPAAAKSGRRAPAQPDPALPEIRDVPARPRKRNGLRQRHGLHVVTGAPPAPGAAPLGRLSAAADARRDIVRALLAPQCPDCSRPGQVGCDKTMDGSALMMLGRELSGPLYAHENRVLTAALAQPDPESFLDEAIAALAA